MLRIEDTDVERNRPELVEGILDGLKWLGVEWDEGPIFSRSGWKCTARRRSDCLRAARPSPAIAKAAAYARRRRGPADTEAQEGEGDDEGPKLHKSVAAPAATYATRSARRRKKTAFRARFVSACRARARRNSKTPFSVRAKCRTRRSRISFCCAPTALPTYQLSVVVDDIDMRITHVIRGADHISNTPKQALIYRALGAAPPIFAHVPLILGPDRTRLSKRHGATSVGSYADEGFLPEAFRNFLALLGWSPGDDSEFMRTTELIERFSLSGVSRTNAVFDRAKLEWFNTQYLQKLPIEELLPYVEAELKRAGLWEGSQASAEREWFAHAVDLIRPRTRLLGISPPGRAHFSPTISTTTPKRAKNSGRTSACRRCSQSWRTRSRRCPSGITMRAMPRCALWRPPKA